MNKYTLYTAILNKLSYYRSKECSVCSTVIKDDGEVVIVYKTDSLVTGFYELTCSELCANMYMLGHMDDLETVKMVV